MPDTSMDAIQTLQQLGLIPAVGGSGQNVPSAPNQLDPNSTDTAVPITPTNPVPPIDLPQLPESITGLANTKPNEPALPTLARAASEATRSSPITDLRSPQNPYGESVNASVPKFGDLGGALGNENNALSNENTAAKDAATAKYLSDKAKSDRVNQVNTDYVNAQAKADIEYQANRDLAHKTAAAETASWMKDMDKKAAEEPQSGRWWSSQSGFSKAMWLLSLAFSSKAAMTPGVKNVAFEMLNAEMDHDVADQKEIKAKQLDILKSKGAKLDEQQKQKLSDMQDNHTQRLGRINALLAANTVKANSTDDKDLKAQYSAIDDHLNQEKVNIAIKRADQATAERMKTVEEQHANARQYITMAHAEKMQKSQFEQQTKEKEMDRDLRRDLANEALAAKLAAAEAKNKSKENEFEFAGGPGQSGVVVTSKDETGKPINYNLSVPKELAKESSDIVQNGQAKVVALSAFRDALKKGDMPYGTFTNDIEARQALKAIADPAIRQMSGRFNKDTVKEVQEYIVGEDPTSILGRIKGGSKEDIIKLLDKEIQEAPGAIKQRLQAIPGSNLAKDPNATISFTTPDTRGPGDHEMTGDEKIEAATGKAAPVVELKSPEDVKQFSNEAQAALPTDLKSIVDDVQSKMGEGHSETNVKSIHDKAVKAIDEWKSTHDNTKATLPANNAVKLIDSFTDKASEASKQIPELIKNLKIMPKGLSAWEDITKDDVKSQLDKRKLTAISAKEIQDIVNEVNAYRDSLPKLQSVMP